MYAVKCLPSLTPHASQAITFSTVPLPRGRTLSLSLTLAHTALIRTHSPRYPPTLHSLCLPASLCQVAQSVSIFTSFSVFVRFKIGLYHGVRLCRDHICAKNVVSRIIPLRGKSANRTIVRTRTMTSPYWLNQCNKWQSHSRR